MRTARQRTFAARIGWCVTCVIPASLLSDEPDEQDGTRLRSEASQDRLSYMQAIRELEEGVYLARVAASPERVAQGYTVLLREEQLAYALPYDQRTVGKSSEEILAQMRAHATEVRPLTPVAVQKQRAVVPVQVAPLTALDTVEVTEEEMQQVIDQVSRMRTSQRGNRQRTRFHFQQGLLCAMIDRLMQELYQGQEQDYARRLYARCARLARLQRWHRQTQGQVVYAMNRVSPKQQQVVWQLTAGFPLEVARAA